MHLEGMKLSIQKYLSCKGLSLSLSTLELYSKCLVDLTVTLHLPLHFFNDNNV